MNGTPSQVGARAECEVARALLSAGWEVYVPLFSAHARADLVALRDDETVRVQCKTARLVKGVVSFRTCSNTNHQPRSNHGEVDAFGVYSPDLLTAYLVPLDGLGDSGCHLRLGPTANNQSKGIRFAADYEIRPLESGPDGVQGLAGDGAGIL